MLKALRVHVEGVKSYRNIRFSRVSPPSECCSHNTTKTLGGFTRVSPRGRVTHAAQLHSGDNTVNSQGFLTRLGTHGVFSHASRRRQVVLLLVSCWHVLTAPAYAHIPVMLAPQDAYRLNADVELVKQCLWGLLARLASVGSRLYRCTL